jgi:hypothetical protein
MKTQRFNRHEEMTPLTRITIMDFIQNRNFKTIENELYGLYDGYFYSETLKTKAKDTTLTSEERIQFTALIETIEGYKTLK